MTERVRAAASGDVPATPAPAGDDVTWIPDSMAHLDSELGPLMERATV